jgi:ferredoxin
MTYRIVVDRSRCESNAVCERIAPEVFQVSEDDELRILKTEVGSDLLEKVRRAVERCPRAALRIEET